MKIFLATLKEGVPVPVQAEYNASELDLEFVDLKYTCPLKLEGSVEKGPDVLTFQGCLTSEVKHICGRCLKEVNEPFQEPFNLYYETQGKDEIDTLEDLREVLILNHGIAYLCKEDCLGICPQCGTNRNENPCQCEEKTISNKVFSSLKKLWQKSKEDKKNG